MHTFRHPQLWTLQFRRNTMTEPRDCKHGRLARSCETCAMQEEIDDLKYELGVAREAQQCECSSDDACRFARERDALKDDIEKLHSVMMAAAVEITSHWDAHCDAEGFGPVNLVRRLENGFPSRYGYDAQTLIRVEAQRDALASSDAALREELGNVKAGLEHYRNLWSEVCDSERGLRNELAALQKKPVVLSDIEQYRMQIAAICTAAIGYWAEGDPIHPDYDTMALRDVARLYAKYAEQYDAKEKTE